jgi:hypothetical protein
MQEKSTPKRKFLQQGSWVAKFGTVADVARRSVASRADTLDHLARWRRVSPRNPNRRRCGRLREEVAGKIGRPVPPCAFAVEFVAAGSGSSNRAAFALAFDFEAASFSWAPSTLRLNL